MHRYMFKCIIFGLQKVKKLDKQLRTASEMIQNQE